MEDDVGEGAEDAAVCAIIVGVDVAMERRVGRLEVLREEPACPQVEFEKDLILVIGRVECEEAADVDLNSPLQNFLAR